MLHLIFHISPAVLARVGKDDALVFLDNAVLRLVKTASHHLLLPSNKRYVLADDLAVRGLLADELITGIEIIDYPALVDLTVQHTPIQTWS